ncbi:MAG: DUF4192 family protein [Nocardioides sp.]|uniref:DUF4192 family protein n=1 Tax=Nocardioides sp. TaxID=35761 RepID=UPI0039E37776
MHDTLHPLPRRTRRGHPALARLPEESIVFLPLRSDLPVARVDIPATARDREVVWRSISDAFRRYAQPGCNVAIVCLSADREQANVVGQDFATRLGDIGIGTPILLWADAARWADLDTGDMGLRTDAARETIAAATVLSGRAQPAASRESLAESLVGDHEPVAALLPGTRETARTNTATAEGRWALARMQRFQRDGVRLSDADAARLLVAVESTPTRDRLWLDMTKRAPDDVRAAPASLLGFASWLGGHGALAWCALDQVPEGKPYALANLVAAAVQSAMHPREWEASKTLSTDRGAYSFAPRQATTERGTTRLAMGM